MAAIEIPDDASDQRREEQPLAIPPIGRPMLVPQPATSPAPSAVPAPPTIPSQPMAFPNFPTAQPTDPSIRTLGTSGSPTAQPAITLPTPKESGLQRLWDKTSDIQNPGIRALAKTGTGVLTGLEAVGSAAFPGIAAMIPGSAMNTRIGNNRADKRAEEEQAMKVGQQKTDAETTTAEANKSKAQTEASKEAREAAAPPKTGNTPEETTIHDLMTGNGGQPRVNPATGQPYSYLEAYQAINQAKQDTKPEKPAKPTFQEQSYEEWKQAHPNGTRMQFEKETKEAERTPRQPTEREEWMKDHPGANIEDYWAAKKGPTNDEQKRADLADSLDENLNALEDIAKRRPELFGPLAGRWAELKQKFGNDDPDLGALQTIEHQIGLTQISAHGMRSAQGVQSAADSIMNHLHNGPKSLLSSIDAARKSVKTFQDQVEKTRPGSTGAGKTNGKLPEGAVAGTLNGKHGYVLNGKFHAD
jgi:hypothetical protein